MLKFYKKGQMSYLTEARLYKIYDNSYRRGIICQRYTVVLGDFGLLKDAGGDDGVNDSEDFKGYFAMLHSCRTPELIAYAKSEANICLESGIFQLGLVLCEMFIGKNSLIDSKDILSPINYLLSLEGKSIYKSCDLNYSINAQNR